MQSEKYSLYPSWLYGPFGGAAAAIVLVFAYAVTFIIYAILRSALLVGSVASDAGFGGTMVAYAAALTIASLTIAALMALPAIVIGLVTAVILRRSVSWFNPRRLESRAMAIGALACFVIVVLFHLLLQQALGFGMSDVVSNPETYLLWLGFPSLIYIAAGGLASRQLLARRNENAP